MTIKNQDLIIFETDKNHTKVSVRLDSETVWLNLNQLSQLFERDKSVISRHLKKVFYEGELESSSVVANFATTAADGKIYQVEHYNLDAIISVGYRVNSKRGTQFRQWANRILKEYWSKESARKVYEELNKDNSLPILSEPTDDSRTQAIIEGYAKTWSLLSAYDENRLDIPEPLHEATAGLEYDTAIADIEKFKK
ncbi:MAG: virulence RhuM family protein, partial [Alphaproteobacteria bacterium]|nr:virulence RhuM family protein [Alphaproteobacteria bacterium]